MNKTVNTFQKISAVEQAMMALLLFGASLYIFFAFDDTLMVIKGFIFTLFLILISYSDYKTQTIPNILLLPIVVIGFIHCDISSLIGIFAVSTPMLMTALIKKDGLGGGDIKMMAACGFVLGGIGIIAAAVIGLGLFILVHIYELIKNSKKRYALAPYLSIGCYIAFVLS
jgi:leader peptidase (prepilin peptidase)/N-methyltransferase